MTPQQIVAIAVRMFSVWLALAAIPYLSSTPHLLLQSDNDAGTTTSILIGIAYLVTAAVVWLFPLSISNKLVPKTHFENRLHTRPNEVATVAISILGLWKFIDAAPDLVSYLFQAYLNAPGGSVFSSLDAKGKADVAFILLEIVIALIFLLKAHAIAKLVIKQIPNETSNDL